MPARRTATVVNAWKDDHNAYLAAAVAEGGSMGRVEYFVQTPLMKEETVVTEEVVTLEDGTEQTREVETKQTVEKTPDEINSDLEAAFRAKRAEQVPVREELPDAPKTISL